jgi:hypothetical protein
MEDLIGNIAHQIALQQAQSLREEFEKRGYTFERLLHSDCIMIEHECPEGVFRQYIVDGEVVLHVRIRHEVILGDLNCSYREIMEILK